MGTTQKNPPYEPSLPGSTTWTLVSSVARLDHDAALSIPSPFEGGPDLFWKLQAETFLLSAGVGGSVVKPCGLGTKPAGRAPIIGVLPYFPVATQCVLR